MTRVYLDHNATTPLRPEARAAMIAAMDVVGNPSSVHAEGRAARAIIEKARQQVATALGADGAEIVFTSGATEAAALACSGRTLVGSEIEHDAVLAWVDPALTPGPDGAVAVAQPARTTLQLANSETGLVQHLPQGLALSDLTQAFGKIPLAFNWLGCDMALVSAHKLGGPKGSRGAGAAQRAGSAALIRGRRAGNGPQIRYGKRRGHCRVWRCCTGGNPRYGGRNLGSGGNF